MIEKNPIWLVQTFSNGLEKKQHGTMDSEQIHRDLPRRLLTPNCVLTRESPQNRLVILVQ